MSRFIAAYDISDNHRRRQVARFLLRYGPRLQESVFDVWIEPGELDDFRRELGSRLDRSDAFDLLPIESRGARACYRWQRPPHVWKPVLML